MSWRSYTYLTSDIASHTRKLVPGLPVGVIGGIAPLNNAKEITKPLFIVQGRNDPRVPASEAQQMLTTLTRSKVPVWFLMANDEGHGFAKKKNADYLFSATVPFIKTFLLN